MSTEHNDSTPPQNVQNAKQIMQKKLRNSLGTGVLAAALLFGLYGWARLQPEDEGLAWPFRRVLEANEKLSQMLFNPKRLAPEFEPSQAKMPRVNGRIGMDDSEEAFIPADWSLNVQAGFREFNLKIADIKALRHVEVYTELKCIEGWSTVVHWGGVRLSEFLLHYNLIDKDVVDNPKKYPDLYLGLSTPDEEYYVAIDMASAVHPQTLLATEMGGAPLTIDHGAPLRLAIPVKYGIKSIKRIGNLRVTNERPPDYWAQQGYDWYAGH